MMLQRNYMPFWYAAFLIMNFEKSHDDVRRFSRKNTPSHRVFLQNRSSALKGLKTTKLSGNEFFTGDYSLVRGSLSS